MSSFYVECIGAEKFQNAEQMLADVPGDITSFNNLLQPGRDAC